MKSTPVGRIVIRPSDETKAIIGITKGADPSLKPGMVYEIRKDERGVMTLHEVGDSCIRGPIKDEDPRQNAVFSWAHDLGLIFDAMGVQCVATIEELAKIQNLEDALEETEKKVSPEVMQHMQELLTTESNSSRFFFVDPAVRKLGQALISAAASKPKALEKELSALFCAIDDGSFDEADRMIKAIGEKWTEKLSELVRAEVSNRRKRFFHKDKESKS